MDISDPHLGKVLKYNIRSWNLKNELPWSWLGYLLVTPIQNIIHDVKNNWVMGEYVDIFACMFFLIYCQPIIQVHI